MQCTSIVRYHAIARTSRRHEWTSAHTSDPPPPPRSSSSASHDLGGAGGTPGRPERSDGTRPDRVEVPPAGTHCWIHGRPLEPVLVSGPAGIQISSVARSPGQESPDGPSSSTPVQAAFGVCVAVSVVLPPGRLRHPHPHRPTARNSKNQTPC